MRLWVLTGVIIRSNATPSDGRALTLSTRRASVLRFWSWEAVGVLFATLCLTCRLTAAMLSWCLWQAFLAMFLVFVRCCALYDSFVIHIYLM